MTVANLSLLFHLPVQLILSFCELYS